MSGDLGSASPSGWIVRGRGIAPGVVCGPVRRNDPHYSSDDVSGAILVTSQTVPDDVERLLAAAGTLTLGGALLSHASLLAREFGKPSIAVGADGGVVLVDDRPGGGLLARREHPAVAVLDEGDIALLDGDRGQFRVPLAESRESRTLVREAYGALERFAVAPDDARELLALVASAERSAVRLLPCLLEAALVYGGVPAGEPRRRLLAAVEESVHGAEARGRLEGLARQVVERGRAGLRATWERLRNASDAAELDRELGGQRRTVSEAQALFAEIGVEHASLADELATLERRVEDRRNLLRDILAAEVAGAARLSEEVLGRRLGTVRRLVARARGAGVTGPEVEAVERLLRRRVVGERRRGGDRRIRRLGASPSPSRAQVGGKAAGLMETAGMLPAGCRIPRGFVLTTAAYAGHVAGAVEHELRRAVALDAQPDTLSHAARTAILGSPVSADVRAEVSRELAALGAHRVAVRSSATVEDGVGASLAGSLDTFLGLPAEANAVVEATRQAWGSLWNERALRVLARVERSPLDARVAVLVQEMVPTVVAGVLTTRDPAAGPGVLLVNAARGLGEGISQGKIPGDVFWLALDSGRTLASEHGDSGAKIVVAPEGGGTIAVDLGREEEGQPCLDEPQRIRLAELARRLDEAYAAALDVEFGFAEDAELYVFQIRRRPSPERGPAERMQNEIV